MNARVPLLLLALPAPSQAPQVPGLVPVRLEGQQRSVFAGRTVELSLRAK
jgi:hypothetical protein